MRGLSIYFFFLLLSSVLCYLLRQFKGMEPSESINYKLFKDVIDKVSQSEENFEISIEASDANISIYSNVNLSAGQAFTISGDFNDRTRKEIHFYENNLSNEVMPTNSLLKFTNLKLLFFNANPSTENPLDANYYFYLHATSTLSFEVFFKSILPYQLI